MPDATVSHEPVRRELKSCPPDGYVDLLQLPYFDMLERRDGASRLYAQASEEGDVDNKLFMESMQQWSRSYEFKKCIVGHNLTDKNGVPLDFSKAETLRSLSPNVGHEIERLIDELNGEAEEGEDFTPAPSSSSLETSIPSNEKDTTNELESVSDET
jgi:hypothetical protein